MRKAKAIYIELTIARESAAVTCILAEAQRQATEWERFLAEGTEGFSWALIGGCWLGESPS